MGQLRGNHATTNMVSQCSLLVVMTVCVSASLAGRVRRDEGYGPPEPTYNEPEPSYDAPVAEYAASAPSYQAEVEPLDLTTLIIPFLAILGLLLLFPNYTTLTSVRRRRETGEEGEPTRLVDRIQDIYTAVVESEECLERVACEVGAIAKDAGLNNSLATTAAFLVPSKYTKFAKQFARSKNCHKIKCGSF